MRRGRSIRWSVARAGVLLGTVAFVASMTVPAGGAVPRPTTWSIQPSPNRPEVANTFANISCVSDAQCVAVGGMHDFSLPEDQNQDVGTLIETYNGTKWSTTASPGQANKSELAGVSCPTATRCYAVGKRGNTGQSLIATSAGGAWSAMTSPVVGDQSTLAGIDCTDDAHCVAVGYSISGTPQVAHTLVMVLAGGTWTVSASPNPGGGSSLARVSCRTSTQCVAVGARAGGPTYRTLALQLNAGVWSAMATPNRGSSGSQLTDVACTSATRCTAVGTSSTANGSARTLVAALASGSWTLVESPNRGPGGLLYSVDCSDATHCIAVGFAGGGPLIEKLSGSTWSIMKNPKRSDLDTLLGVDCVSSSTCFAVGASIGDGGANDVRTLAMRSS